MAAIDHLTPINRFLLDILAETNNISSEEALAAFWQHSVSTQSLDVPALRSMNLSAAAAASPQIPPRRQLPLFARRQHPPRLSLSASWFSELMTGQEKSCFSVAPVRFKDGVDIAVSWNSLAAKLRYKRGGGLPLLVERLASFSKIDVTRATRGRHGIAYWCSDLENIFAALDISRKYSWIDDWLEAFDGLARLTRRDFFNGVPGGVFHDCRFRVSRAADVMRVFIGYGAMQIPPQTYEVPVWQDSSGRVEFEPVQALPGGPHEALLLDAEDPSE